MARRDVSPPPTTYTLPTDFQFQHKGRMFSFGTCREACAKVSAKGELGQDRAIPGPGTYEVREVPGKDARKFSFRPRTTNPSTMRSLESCSAHVVLFQGAGSRHIRRSGQHKPEGATVLLQVRELPCRHLQSSPVQAFPRSSYSV